VRRGSRLGIGVAFGATFLAAGCGANSAERDVTAVESHTHIDQATTTTPPKSPEDTYRDAFYNADLLAEQQAAMTKMGARVLALCDADPPNCQTTEVNDTEIEVIVFDPSETGGTILRFDTFTHSDGSPEIPFSLEATQIEPQPDGSAKLDGYYLSLLDMAPNASEFHGLVNSYDERSATDTGVQVYSFWDGHPYGTGTNSLDIDDATKLIDTATKGLDSMITKVEDFN